MNLPLSHLLFFSPHPRYGSCSDQYGFKRCSSAVTGFKKLWNEQMALLSGGQRSVFLEYASIAVDVRIFFQNPLKILKFILFFSFFICFHSQILAGECVRFDRREDNKYKEMCIKKVETLVKKVTEGRNVPPLSEAEKTLLQKYRNSLQSSFREYLPAPPPPQQQDPPPESSPEAPPQQQAPPPEAPPQAAELPPPTLVSESTVG